MNINNIKEIDLVSEETRLSTFTQWPYSDDHNCNARKMAEAGFYFIGNKTHPDLVKCFFCDKELDYWDVNDDPMKEHLKHQKYCKFARLQCSEDGLTLDQFLKIKEMFVKRVIEKDIIKLNQIISLYNDALTGKKNNRP